MIELVAYSLLIMLVSLVGVVSVWRKAGRLIERNLSLLVSFSAGVFLVIAYHLGVEAVEHAASTFGGLVWIALGSLGVWFLFRLLPPLHHHHDASIEDHPHTSLDARRIMTSDALHNIGDGVLLAAAFATSSALGFMAAVSIVIHELVQEVSEFFVLKQAGYSTKKALVLNFAFSSTILIGALGGFFLLESFEALEVPLLGLAAGAFLLVVLHDLIPHSVRESHRQSLYLKHGVFFLVGLAAMILINFFVGH